MRHIHLLRHWCGHADPGMEAALHDVPMPRDFAGLDAGLERHQLAQDLFDQTAPMLAGQGLLLRQGTIVDATLSAAPPSTENRERKRAPEMTSTRKGNNHDFGPKAHIGVDATSGLVHSVAVATAKVSGGAMAGRTWSRATGPTLATTGTWG